MTSTQAASPAPQAPRVPDRARDFSALVGDRFVTAGERDTLLRNSPAHGVPVSRYPRATAVDVDAAVTAARRAFDEGPWPKMSGAERAKVLLRVADAIERNREELALIESLEVGKPLSAAMREMGGSVGLWEFAATLARHAYGDLHDKIGAGMLGLVFREPVGVVGMITPWNYPLLIVSQKLPYALAVGCTAVVKPSELTSGTCLRLGELMMECGVPPGVVNLLVGEGPDVGEAICRAPGVDMISFTGSTRVGRAVGRICGESIKRVSLELGGKSAQIVCADADLELAAEKVTMGATRNAGQACVSGSRLLVERSIAESFTARVTAKMHAIRVGDPLDAATEMGPLVSQAQYDRVASYIASGERDGAVLHRPADAVVMHRPGEAAAVPQPAGAAVSSAASLTGGNWFMRPGVFTGVTPTMTIAREEIFGPILSVIPFDTVDEAIAVANGTDYGLAAGVWSRDINKALSIGRAMRAGTVEVNTYMAGVPELPLSGHKQSGVGHEKGRYAIEEFTTLKTIHVQLANP